MLQSSKYYRRAPTITIFLFAYNQEDFIKDACLSVLAQDYGLPIEIIFSDDCSQDRTFEIMTQVANDYNGIHSLTLNRNKNNLGLIGHVNLSYELSNGELIFAAAGDDTSLPNRVSETVAAYRSSKNTPMSIYSSVYEMDENDNIGSVRKPPVTQNITIEKCALSSALIIGASHAWHRDIFDIFGKIQETGAYEDLVLAYRSALFNGLVYLDKPLVNYRLDIGISHQHANKKSNLEGKEKFINSSSYYNKVMIPVLKQRLKDTNLVDKDSVRKKIAATIKKKEAYHNYLIGNYSFFETIAKLKNPIIILNFANYWFKLAKKGFL